MPAEFDAKRLRRRAILCVLGSSASFAVAAALVKAVSPTIPVIERRAQGIHDAAAQAHALMESLFAWASVQMDTLAVSLGEVDLAGVVDETMRGAAQAAADKGIALDATGAAGRVLANRDMLATVLRNLVSNAVKFTMPGGSVSIAATPFEDGVEVSVTDTGVGLPPSKLDELFRLDRRTSTTGTAGERGSGLGLLLCRDLLARQESVLEVRSVVGQGTICSFRLGGVRPGLRPGPRQEVAPPGPGS